MVDLRARRAFAAGHLAGTLSFDLDGSFATYLGWLIPRRTPVTLLGQTPEQVAEAQRELVRIGIDRPAAMAVGDPAQWSGGRSLRSFPVADFAGLQAARRHRPVVILDVRRDLEWAESRIDRAIHIPLHQLPGRLAGLPEGELWVYCRSGYRAAVAASILDAAGRTVVAIDDDYDRAATAGLLVANPAGPGSIPTTTSPRSSGNSAQPFAQGSTHDDAHRAASIRVGLPNLTPSGEPS